VPVTRCNPRRSVPLNPTHGLGYVLQARLLARVVPGRKPLVLAHVDPPNSVLIPVQDDRGQVKGKAAKGPTQDTCWARRAPLAGRPPRPSGCLRLPPPDLTCLGLISTRKSI
jgi:hypothetical protein